MQEKAPVWLLVLGWIFAVLGGLIGIIVGAYLRFAKVTRANGDEHPRYDEGGRSQGLAIIFVSVAMLVIWNIAFSMS